MTPELRARLGPRVKIRPIERFSGPRGTYSLRLNQKPYLQPVSLAQLFMRCGLTPLEAKDAMEYLIYVGPMTLELLSTSENILALLADLNVDAQPAEPSITA
jgi:hypothetical protein